MKHVVIIGPQGAGKGTQALRIADRFNLIHLSTGDIFRELMRSESDLADEVRSYVDRGALVPDSLTAKVLFSRLDDLVARDEPVGALFDGYPRNAAQAEVLDATIDDRGELLAAVVHLDVPVDVLNRRIQIRAEREGRADDNPEALKQRLRIYFEETKPLVDRWRHSGKVIDIDGDQSIDCVTADILSSITPYMLPDSPTC